MSSPPTNGNGHVPRWVFSGVVGLFFAYAGGMGWVIVERGSTVQKAEMKAEEAYLNAAKALGRTEDLPAIRESMRGMKEGFEKLEKKMDRNHRDILAAIAERHPVVSAPALNNPRSQR